MYADALRRCSLACRTWREGCKYEPHTDRTHHRPLQTGLRPMARHHPNGANAFPVNETDPTSHGSTDSREGASGVSERCHQERIGISSATDVPPISTSAPEPPAISELALAFPHTVHWTHRLTRNASRLYLGELEPTARECMRLSQPTNPPTPGTAAIRPARWCG